MILHNQQQFARIVESVEWIRDQQAASGIAIEGVVRGADGEGVCQGADNAIG